MICGILVILLSFLHAFYTPKKYFLFSLCIQDKIYTFSILWCNIWNNLIIFYKIYIFQDIHSHIPYILCFFLQFLHFIQFLDFYSLNVYNFQTSCELVRESTLFRFPCRVTMISDFSKIFIFSITFFHCLSRKLLKCYSPFFHHLS